MNQQNCPPKQTLIDFLLGKLTPASLAHCEKHLNDCQPCGETIRSLDCTDTLVRLAGQASPLENTSVNNDPEQLVVKMLIDKLEGIGPTRGVTPDHGRTSNSRSDDVISQLQPGTSSDSIGRVAHYEIKTVLGHGATSVVFLARDEQLYRDVALKVLRPSLGEEARTRFLAEARAAAALNHENITTIYEVATEGHLAYMAQQWLPGETLEARLTREPDLKIDEIKTIARQVANGLAAAHAKNLIHRDIKPANIWIESERDRAIILDFGLVRVADGTPQMTETGMIAGTPDFMSPEQARGRDVDSRSDLFSLGCVMYRLFSGRLPFHTTNTLATLQSILNDEPAPLSHLNQQVPAELSQLTMMLLNKDAAQRPKTADQVASALQNPTVLKELLATRPKPQKKSEPSNTGPERIWWLRGAAAVAIVAGMIFGGPQVVRVATNQGVLEIESDDPDVVIEVLRNGQRIDIIDNKTDQRLTIAAGIYEIKPTNDVNEFELSSNLVTLKRGGKVIVSVTKKTNDRGVAGERTSSNDVFFPATEIVQRHQQLAKLRVEIEEAQSEFAQLTNKKTQMETALADGDKSKEELLFMLKRDGTIKVNHRAETIEFQLESKLVRLKEKFGPAHPEVKKVEKSLEYFTPGPSLSRCLALVNRSLHETGTLIKEKNVRYLELTGKQSRDAARYDLSANSGTDPRRFSSQFVPLNSKTPAPDALTYEGESLNYWINALATERSPKRVRTALDAFIHLVDSESSKTILREVFKASRVFGWISDESELPIRAMDVISRCPAREVASAMLNELKTKNSKSLGFIGLLLETVDTGQLSPEIVARFDEFQLVIGELLDSSLSQPIIGDDHLLIVNLYLNLLKFVEDENNVGSQVAVNHLCKVLPNIKESYSATIVGTYLVENGPDRLTPEIDAVFNRALIESAGQVPTQANRKMHGQYLSGLPNTVLAIFSTLKTVPEDSISQATIDTIIRLVKNKDFWPKVMKVDGKTLVPRADAIELLGRIGPRAKSALPILNELAVTYPVNWRNTYHEGETPAYKKVAQAIIRITTPAHSVNDVLELQGVWNLKSLVKAGKERPLESEDFNVMRIDRLNVTTEKQAAGIGRGRDGGGLGADSGGGARGGAGGPKSVDSGRFVFTDTAGQFDIASSKSEKIEYVIYKIEDGQLTLCSSGKERPSSFDTSNTSWTLQVYERD